MERITIRTPIDAETINAIEAKHYECETATRNIAFELSKGSGFDTAGVKYQLERLHKFYPIYNQLKDDLTTKVIQPIIKENHGTGACTWNLLFDKKEAVIDMEVGEWNDEVNDPNLSIPMEKVEVIKNAKNDSEIYGNILSYLSDNALLQSTPANILDDLNDRQVKAMKDYGNARNAISTDIVSPYLTEHNYEGSVTWNLDFSTGKITFIKQDA